MACETTKQKSIEEIAREDGWSEADSYFDDVLSVGELVRRSDREHWLEVACKAECPWCRLGDPVVESKERDRLYFRHIGQREIYCDASLIRRAFAAQEKNHG